MKSFRPITLGEMDGVQLMNRTDTKFMFNHAQLREILPVIMESYRALDIEGVRQSRYATLYFDTPEFLHYLLHQNGRRHRFKIRKREYVESHLAFLEVKEKNNRGRTAKFRIKVQDILPTFDERGWNFVTSKVHSTTELEPKIWNSFTRTTLVDNQAMERVTLDTNIAYHIGDRELALEGLVIAEVKQDGNNRHSRFISEMKSRLIRPEGISKYCLGVAMMYHNVKANSFKEKILKIKKILSYHDTTAH